MMHNETINELLPIMKAFPEPSHIFIQEQSWLAKHFLPLLSIDLGELKPKLSGTVVHMLNPIEPFDGHIGEDTEKFHNEYCGENFYAFRLTDDNRYEFLGNEGYFVRADIHQDPQGFIDEEDVQEKFETYAKTKERFMQTGKLTQPMYSGELNERTFLNDFGGDIGYGNWISTFSYPDRIRDTFYRFEHDKTNDNIQIFYKDEPFFLVGWTAGYHWCSGGADAIMMMYEPKNRIVLFSLDWS